jgi:hypothetical protein
MLELAFRSLCDELDREADNLGDGSGTVSSTLSVTITLHAHKKWAADLRPSIQASVAPGAL